MGSLTERLEIRLPRQQLQLLRHEARRRGVPVAHLVREAISMLLEQDTLARLQAAEELFKLEAPVANWEEMKREIEEGRLRAKQP